MWQKVMKGFVEWAKESVWVKLRADEKVQVIIIRMEKIWPHAKITRVRPYGHDKAKIRLLLKKYESALKHSQIAKMHKTFHE